MESFPIPGWVPLEVRQAIYQRFYMYKMPVEKSSDYDFAHLDAYYREIFYKPMDNYFEDYLKPF